MVVIMIGRKRSRQACLIASAGPMPCERRATCAKSIIMMAFFFTMPINSTIPMADMMSNSILHNSSARNAPRPAEGKVDKIVIGCT